MSIQPPYSRIISTGSYLPAQTLTNADLEKRMDTTDEWIVSRTGIRARHIAGPDDTTSYMALQAAKAVLKNGDVDANTIDMIVVGTCSSDYSFPSTACYLQKALGIQNHCPSFDLSAACSGFMYALSVADQFIRQRQVKRVLVLGVEKISRLTNWEDRNTCVLFGDGAGGVVLEASQEPGIYSTHLHADAEYSDALYAHHPLVKPDDYYIHMTGNTIFKYAVNHMGEMVQEALQANQFKDTDLDWLVPHQANLRIIQAMAEKLGMPMEKVIVTLEDHANTSAASVPLALDHAVQSGKIKRGDLLLLEAFGGGLTWASALVRY